MVKLKLESIVEDFQTMPKALLKCLRYYLSPEGAARFKKIPDFIKSKSIRRIIFIGHSYNYFASQIPFNYISRHGKIKNAQIYEVDEFLHYFTPRKFCQHSIFCFISHSGNSNEIKLSIEKLIKAKINPLNIWGVSNNENSCLEGYSDLFFPSVSGQDKVIGTKSYINTILVLYFIARTFMDQKTITNQLEEEIRQLIFEIKFYGNDWEFHVKSLTEFLGTSYEFLYLISKGASLATAYQSAVSFKSYTRTYGEGSNIGLFLHGPFQIVQSHPESFRCVVIVGDEINMEDTVRLIDIVSKKLGSGKVILINNSRELSSLGRSIEKVWVFEHTTKNPFLAPIFEYIVIQYLILDQSLRRGVIEK